MENTYCVVPFYILFVKVSVRMMENANKIVIRTRFNQEFRFVLLNSDDLSLENYMEAGKTEIL